MTEKFAALMDCHPFTTPVELKNERLLAALQEAMTSHYRRCERYRIWCDKRHFDPQQPMSGLDDIPFLPVNIFKRLTLKSTDDDDIVRTLKSSATSSQIPSQVFLDRVTRDRQMRVLANTLKYLIGEQRRPFIVLDVQPSQQQTASAELSARVAGMRGYLMAASRVYYVLNYNNGVPELDVDALAKAIDEMKRRGESFCLLGYTFVLYQYVLKTLIERGVSFSLPESTLLMHFGGWKKLEHQKIGKTQLTSLAAEVFRINRGRICDIYGFTEQLGVIYPDDSEGIKRAPVYADVIVRDPVTLQVVPDGEVGLLEFVTPLPHSYPGMVLLTDDMGRIVTRRPAANGWRGCGFEVVGRARNAEVRGCGDTLPDRIYQVA